MELTANNVLALFYTSKQERQTFVTDAIERIIDGHEDPIKALITLKCMEEIIDKITGNKSFRDACITEAEKYGKTFDKVNAKLAIREAGVRYNFEECGDLELLELMTMRAELDEKIKKRQEFIKMIPIEGIEVINEDGVISHIYPPSKTSTTTLTVTLK